MRRAIGGGVALLLLAAVWASAAEPLGESWVVAVTDRAGALGFLGHRHAIEVTEWSAQVEWRPEESGGSRALFGVPASGLRIDGDRARELAGLGDGPSAADVETLQAKLLGPENLDAEAHPELRLEVTEVERAGRERLRVGAALTIKGRTRTVRFPVRVERAGAATVFTGSFTVRQSDFGIEPESVAGVVRVADPVEIRFRIVHRTA